MHILLDENLPRRLGSLLAGHESRTVAQMGWTGIKNGRLLALAEKHFDIFLTADKGFATQQNLTKFNLAIFVLRSKSNSL